MTSLQNVALIVGSLRKDSLSRKAAVALVKLAPANLRFTHIEIGQLPLYNPDDEFDPPSSWLLFRQQIAAADALLFVTPEYNRSLPGALKNAIDVGSRPYGQSSWNNKPGAVISVSPGALGAFGANHHLRQALVFLNVPTMQQPEAYIGGADLLFDDSKTVKNDTTRAFLATFARAFADWITIITKSP